MDESALAGGPVNRLRYLEDLAEPYCAFDLDHKLIYLNPAAEVLLGRSSAALLGLNQQDIFGPEITGQIKQQEEARAQGRATVYEAEGRDVEGRVVTYLITGSPLHDEAGIVVGSCGVIRDITARHRREQEAEHRSQLTLAMAQSMRALLTQADFNQALRDTLQNIGLTLNARSGALFHRDAAGVFHPTHEWQDEADLLEARVVRHSDIDERRFPWWLGQLQKHRLLYIPSPESLPPEAVLERRAMAVLDISSLLGMAIVYGGRQQGFVTFENPKRIEHYSPQDLSLLMMLSDVFASSLNRQQTERERSLLITAVEQSEASVVITDATGTILYLNPAFERITGYSRREAIGRNPRILKSGKHDDAFYKAMWDNISMGLTWNGELVNRRKNGTLFHESVSISPVQNASGETTHFVAVKRDLTHERQLESQLRQAKTLEAVGRLAAGVAHEINTPTQYIWDNIAFVRDSLDSLLPLVGKALHGAVRLSACEEGTQLAEEILAGTIGLDLDFLLDEIPRALAQSQEGVQRVTSIVQAMKEFSHPGSSSKQAGDINRMLRSTMLVARSEWKHVATIELDLAQDLPEIACLVADLNQVFLNLITNAAQAIGETGAGQGEVPKGKITVRTRQRDQEILIEVEDTGGGIPADVLPNIFTPFFTTKEVGMGTGQGLAVAQNVVVDKHQGRIEVETHESISSIFRIFLPLSTVDALPSGDLA
jgi:PAS domain S-box-containing protein